jgi:hypothetical protein
LRHQNTKNYIINRAYNCSGESDHALQRSPESLLVQSVRSVIQVSTEWVCCDVLAGYFLGHLVEMVFERADVA